MFIIKCHWTKKSVQFVQTKNYKKITIKSIENLPFTTSSFNFTLIFFIFLGQGPRYSLKNADFTYWNDTNDDILTEFKTLMTIGKFRGVPQKISQQWFCTIKAILQWQNVQNPQNPQIFKDFGPFSHFSTVATAGSAHYTAEDRWLTAEFLARSAKNQNRKNAFAAIFVRRGKLGVLIFKYWLKIWF